MVKYQINIRQSEEEWEETPFPITIILSSLFFFLLSFSIDKGMNYQISANAKTKSDITKSITSLIKINEKKKNKQTHLNAMNKWQTNITVNFHVQCSLIFCCLWFALSRNSYLIFLFGLSFVAVNLHWIVIKEILLLHIRSHIELSPIAIFSWNAWFILFGVFGQFKWLGGSLAGSFASH